MVIVGVDMDITVSLIMGMADIQITDMVITDIGILIETAMAIDCENAFRIACPVIGRCVPDIIILTNVENKHETKWQ